jgi:hypothetical protein
MYICVYVSLHKDFLWQVQSPLLIWYVQLHICIYDPFDMVNTCIFKDAFFKSRHICIWYITIELRIYVCAYVFLYMDFFMACTAATFDMVRTYI